MPGNEIAVAEAQFDRGNAAPLGFPALIEEMSEQGVSARRLLTKAGIWQGDVEKSLVSLPVGNRLSLFRAARSLAPAPDTALRAGRRQRIANFGVYGFALATSKTFADALSFGRTHIDLAGSVIRISFERCGDVGVLRSHNPRALGDVLPFAAEFWRSSMSTLMSHVLGAPFPSLAMYFPFPAPSYRRAYRQTFDCPIFFDSDIMEWHFDAAILDAPCANSDQLTSSICQKFCERIISGGDGQTPFQREIKSYILGRATSKATAKSIAADLGISLRTLHRRLSEEGVAFQTLLDDTRKLIAIEYLENTTLSIEEIAARCGYGDVSNFRKAFRRWTGKSPSKERRGRQ